MPRRKLTPDLFDEMLASYEAWDPEGPISIDEWAEQWPVSKQAFYNGMKQRGLQPKSMRPAAERPGEAVNIQQAGMFVELLLVARTREEMLKDRLKVLEDRLRAAGLPVD